MNTERVWTIGSAAECDIRIASPTVSGRHCRLTRRGQSFFIEDLGSTNGTYVAGQRITQPRVVRAGESVTLGQQTPMPWPDLSSATIGRLPDNDIVVPLDTVSSHHARLERRGSRVFLIDLESRNGTSLNDPLNKIKSTELRSGDIVFLGTHRITADELLAALPAEAANQSAGGQRTQFEGAPMMPASPRAAVGSARDSSAGGIPAWAIAAGAAGAVVLLAFVVMLVAWPKTQIAAAPSDPSPQPPPAVAPVPTNATVAVVPHPTAVPIIPSPKVPDFDEQLVRRSEKGVYVVCLRVGTVVQLTKATAWAVSPDTVVCPTVLLEEYEKMAKGTGGKSDACCAVCNPARTLRILDHKRCEGDGTMLSTGRLEAPTDTAAVDRAAALAFAPVPGQKLAVIVARGISGGKEGDDPKTIATRVVSLTVDLIQRQRANSPVKLICTAAEDIGGAVGPAPVFDSSGCAVGCVESSKKGGQVSVVPLRLLKIL